MITDEAIEKVPKIYYKNIPESEYDIIQELAKNVLRISKEENNSNEVAITYKMVGSEYFNDDEDCIGVTLGDEHAVDPLRNTTAYHLIASSAQCIVIVLHNHPSLSNFSLSDVHFFLQYDSVKMIVAVTNLGNISYLVKGKRCNYESAINLFNESATLHNEADDLKGFQKAANHFLKNCCSVGIER